VKKKEINLHEKNLLYVILTRMMSCDTNKNMQRCVVVVVAELKNTTKKNVGDPK
jgi:hypothetical protein